MTDQSYYNVCTCVNTSVITKVAACPEHFATNLTAEFKALVTHVDNRMLF